MAEMVLPGVFIEVRAEGLIVPGQVTVGNLGVVGTARKGPIGEPVILGSYSEARQVFGDYDPWLGSGSELTLVRALELAYNHGATTVFAVRVASGAAARATYTLNSAGGANVTLTAKTEGTWGNDLAVNVWSATENAFVDAEEHSGAEATPGPMALTHRPIVKSARNRVSLHTDADGLTRPLQILYGGGLSDDDAGVPGAGQVRIDRTTGALTFGDAVAAADAVTVSYTVNRSAAAKVTIRSGRTDEVYTVVSGSDLTSEVNRLSTLVDATDGANADELPSNSLSADAFANFRGGLNGETGANYQTGLDAILNEEAHIIVAAGQDNSFGDELDAHCQQASSDAIKHERIAVTGSALGATADTLRGHTLDSDRVLFVAPGIVVNDNAATPPVPVTLPGSYAAAAIAGKLAGLAPHVSLTNKTLSVGGLEQRFTSAELTQLVLARVLALEERQGFRVVKGITTATFSAWAQITTRRIVDYAKFGVRSAANPYIGLLNNERVRGALHATINSFLVTMVQDEMLVSYDLKVTATRAEEIRGIVQVTMTLRPTFSIDFIKVTMFLE